MNESIEPVGVSYDSETECANPHDLLRCNLETWNESDYVTQKKEEAKALACP